MTLFKICIMVYFVRYQELTIKVLWGWLPVNLSSVLTIPQVDP